MGNGSLGLHGQRRRKLSAPATCIRRASLGLCLETMLHHASRAAPRTSSSSDSRDKSNGFRRPQVDQVGILRRDEPGRHAIRLQRGIRREAHEARVNGQTGTSRKQLQALSAPLA